MTAPPNEPDSPASNSPFRAPTAAAPDPLPYASPFRRYLPYGFSLASGIAYGLAARILFGLGTHSIAAHHEFADVMSIAFLFGVPTAIGLLYAFRYPQGYPLTLWGAMGGAVVASLLAVLATFLLAIEGAICVAMATPIFLVCAALGAAVGWGVRRALGPRAPSRTALLSVAGLLPFVLAPVEQFLAPPTEVREVRNEITIHASPEAVWREIRSVPRIRREEIPWTLSHAIGLPRPLEATLDEQRVGGARIATFERGLAFREVVTAWEPGRRLAFGIHAESVPSTALDEHVGVGGAYFDVLEGTYTLETLGSREVRLKLSSRQRLSMRFNRYAALWTDFVMGDLQGAILDVVRKRAEAHPE